MDSQKSVARLLEDRERQLLVPQARKTELVSQMLAEDFVEFGSSGRQFTKMEIVALLQQETPVEITASDFNIRFLSLHTALVTYRALRHSEPPLNTLRSSIWQHRDGRWQIVFHQGTPTASKA